MLQYIQQIKRQFRDRYGFEPIGGTYDDPIFDNIPDGSYPMWIDNKLDNVIVKNSAIRCCNYLEDTIEV
jgi:hypothetical protein